MNIYIDCDKDAVLVKVNQVGEAACHTGMKSCFFSEIVDGEIKDVGKKCFNPEDVYGKKDK